MWLVRELVKSGVLGADGVCMTFMKQIAGKLVGRSEEEREGRSPEISLDNGGCLSTYGT